MSKRVLLTLAFAALFCTSADAKDSVPLRKDIPKAKVFTKHVLEVMKSYPTDGTHRYWWPRKQKVKFSGTTTDLVYKGQTIAHGEPKKRAFCCGLTFEVYVRAWEAYRKSIKKPFDIAGLTPKQMLKLRSHWYVATPDLSGCQGALVSRGLGKKIKAKDARMGDFVQLWRGKGSGHSVIFIGWVKDRSGKLLRLRYWSTQPSTKGIGENSEAIGGKGVDLAKTYFVRAGR